MSNTDTLREDRLRRRAKRQCLRLCKSLRRDPFATSYGRYVLIDDASTHVVFGDPTHYASLDQIEAYLTKKPVPVEA